MKKAMCLSILAILSFSSIASADPVGENFYTFKHIEGNNSHAHTILLRRNEVSQFVVRGEGNLDCFLYDQEFNLIDKDLNETSQCDFQVSPKETSRFTIKVVNSGANSTSYALRVF